jgi:uncharacterized membrane protein
MGGWAEFVLAFAVFLASHAVPARPPVRRRLVGLLGERAYLLAYAAVSLAVLAWLISAAGRAPYVALWNFRPWQLWVPNLVMPLVCLLAAYGIAAPNPLSFGGRRTPAFAPERPGVLGIVRHPLLWALALWAAGHAVPNGDLAHVLLFGTFAGFALFGMRAIDRRNRRLMGAEAWERLAGRTSFWPFAALLAGRWRPSRPAVQPLRLAAAVVLYLALLFGHSAVIGVSPVPLH